MRRHLAFPILLAVAACGAGAQEGQPSRESGGAARLSYDVGAFDSVAAAGPHHVVVTTGAAPSVRAEGDPDVLEHLEVKVDGDTLKIGTRSRRGWSFGGRSPATIYVTVPEIRGASVAGSGDMRIDRIEGEAFSGSVAGSGDLHVESLRAAATEFSIAGSGNIRASGAGNRSEVSIAGSGDADLSGFETRSADVSIAGSGNVRMRATESASVSIIGSGDVEIAGGARCSVSKMGSGNVRCG